MAQLTANAESKQEWTKPELRKIDLVEVTALGTGPGGDASTLS